MDNFDDKKTLRKNTFISNNERVDILYQSEMRCMGWDTGQSTKTIDIGYSPLGWPTAPEYHRALRNSDILEYISIYLPREDLLNCRLVCKFWSSEIAMILYKRKNIIVVNEHCPVADDLVKKRQSGNPISLNKLSLFDISSKCILFKKLFIHFGLTLSRISVEDCKLTPKDLKTILVDNAPNVGNLCLRENECVQQTQSNKRSTFKQIKYLNKGTFCLPNMKSLYWDEEYGHTSLEDILEACPNLVTLEMRKVPVPKVRAFKGGKWDSLKRLFLSPKSVLVEEHCIALTRLQLKLKKLTVFGINPRGETTMQLLTKFLETLSESLERLEMWLDYPSILQASNSKSFSPFPVNLPQLKSLHTETALIGSLKNMRLFSSLKELEMVSHGSASGNWSCVTQQSTIFPQTCLTTFKCGEIDEGSLTKVMKTYPCITSLHLDATHVNDKVFRRIVTNLPELRELVIVPCMTSNVLNLTDSGVTGVPKRTCKAFLKNPESVPNRFDPVSLKTHPGIGDLKHLQCLSLGFQAAELSDASTFFGFSRLTQVRSLKFPVCRITDLSLDIIDHSLPNLFVLGVTGCTNLTREAIQNMKTRRSSLHLEGEWMYTI